MINLERVQKIARTVRAVCRQYVLSHQSMHEPYHGDPSLAGMCGVASSTLRSVLIRYGYKDVDVWQGEYLKRQHMFGYDHCWVLWDKHRIDITVSQFNVPKTVHVTRLRNKQYKNAEKWEKSDYTLDEHVADQLANKALWRMRFRKKTLKCT